MTGYTVPTIAYVVLGVSVLGLLAIDILTHRGHAEPTTKRALLETLVYIGAGVIAGIVVWLTLGSQAGGEYFSGYIVEKSLSIDNVFVWSLIFSSFAIPNRYQHRVLFWGIFGALALRAGFIFAGAALVERFSWVLVLFGVFLLVTAVKVVRHRDDEGHVETNRIVGWLEKFLPITDTLDGHKFLTVRNGIRMATPLLTALVVVEFTDVIFAVDSVPAVLAISKQPFIVLASNAFAILGLRAMYFLLADLKNRFHYLAHALGFILGFVGLKMVVSPWVHLNTFLSLGVIVAIVVAAVVGSIAKTNRLARAAGDSESAPPALPL